MKEHRVDSDNTALNDNDALWDLIVKFVIINNKLIIQFVKQTWYINSMSETWQRHFY